MEHLVPKTILCRYINKFSIRVYVNIPIRSKKILKCKILL